MNWQKEVIWGIKRGELSTLIGIYLFFFLLYGFTLTFNELAYEKIPFYDLLSKYLTAQFIDYLLKFILTIPIWYLYFKILVKTPMAKKIILHIFTLVIFVFVWQQSYYFILETLDKGHLEGSSQIWDIYIPSLIYVIQFGVFHAYQYYTELQKQKENEAILKETTLKSELSALKAQLNPHFLYNIFNTISASVPPEMESTREMIATLSDMFRYQLKASKEDLVDLKEEIDFVEKYLSLEKQRFGDRLKINVNIEKDLYTHKIPPMILQPLVENSIKHGISSIIAGGEISISVKKVLDKMHFEIKDTGVGIEDTAKIFGNGVGLTNTKLRLEKMYNSTLEIIQNKPMGTIIAFSI